MQGRLDSKVAIVTGAGSTGAGWGNGKAVATLFAREGAKVVAADINVDAAIETRTLSRVKKVSVLQLKPTSPRTKAYRTW